MIRLLVLEDDPEVRYGIYDYLKQDYEVFVTKRKNEVFKIFNQTNIDLIIFDYSIIDTDLKRFVEEVKEVNKNTLVMSLTSYLDEADKNNLFHSNIDDYMNKPLDMMELQFRIEHLLKKQSNQYRKLIKTVDLTINCETNTVIYCDNKFEFFNKEFQILYHLFSYPNRIFAKEEFIELIRSNSNHYINQNTIRTYINTLRRKLDTIDGLEIITVRGIGYKGIIKNSNCH